MFNLQSASNNKVSSYCTEGEEKEDEHILFTINYLAPKQMALSKPTFNKFCTCFNQFQSSKRFFTFVQSNNNTTSAALKKSRHFQLKSNTPIVRLLATESKGPKSSILLSPIVTKDRLILLGFGGMNLFLFYHNLFPYNFSWFTFLLANYLCHTLLGFAHSINNLFFDLSS